MPKDESPNRPMVDESSSLAGDAEVWGRTFVRLLRDQYAQNVAALPTAANHQDFWKAMIRAILEIAPESGARPDFITASLNPATGELQDVAASAPWTEEKNIRRLELIDRSIQKVITSEESIELDRLTAQLRAVYDREEYVPLEGARHLLKRLLDSAVPDKDSK